MAESKTYAEATAKITPDYRAQAAADSINPAVAKGVTAAGYLEDCNSFASMMNSKGLFAYNQSTSVDFTVTMRSNDGTGSGWVTRDFNDVSKLNTAEASEVAIDKALQSRMPKPLSPENIPLFSNPLHPRNLSEI